MTKTEHYNLKKPGPNDPLSLADFNENADIIDAALAALNTAVAGGAKAAAGSYVGTGTCGASNQSKLDFADTLGMTPKFVYITSGGSYQLYLIQGMKTQNSYGTSYPCTITWTDTGLKWYSEDVAAAQLNNKSTTYYYVAIA